MNYRDHLLVILMEESAEVTQTCSKALRFGLNDGYPGSGTTNLDDLRTELSQLVAVVNMLEEDLKSDYSAEESALFDAADAKQKKEKVDKFLELSYRNGRLS